MKLTQQEYREIMAISKWFNVKPDTLIHKLLQDQLSYIRSVQKQCLEKQDNRKKYELALRLKLLD